MIPFMLSVLALFALTALFMLPPLLRRQAPQAHTAQQQEENLQILRTQLVEIEQEYAAGQLQESDYRQTQNEIKRRLLEENSAKPTELAAEPAAAPVLRPNHPLTALLATLFILITASATYWHLGKPEALDPSRLQAPQAMTEAQIEGMVQKLADRLAANPEDEEGWIMLARSYKILNRPAEAAAAYAHAEKRVATDPDLLADYAEVLAMSSETGLEGKPETLIKAALVLQPDNAQALFMAGALAMQRGQVAEAVQYWEQVQTQLEPGSELHTVLQSTLEKLRAQLKKP